MILIGHSTSLFIQWHVPVMSAENLHSEYSDDVFKKMNEVLKSLSHFGSLVVS